jgi:DNA-binding CsgD family transcriptional regulator
VPSRRRRVQGALRARLATGAGLGEVVAAADAVLRAALGAEGSAWGTVDPATTLSTSCARFGALDTGPAGHSLAAARERRLFELEWADDAPHTFWDLARRSTTAAALRTAVPDPRGVRRFTELLEPAGIHDELRLRLALDGDQWATAIFYRFEQRPFTAEDVAVAAASAPQVARAVRTALLRAVCDSPQLDGPPGSLLLDRAGEVLVSSAAAEDLLALLAPAQAGSVLANLVASTRARGATSMTVAGPGGVLAVHGSLAKGTDDAVAAVVERPRAVELSPWIMRALGFTARERQVAEALLGGATRSQLARRLRISEHTAGDHLQALYRKAGVAGRAELAALLYGGWYEQRRAAGVPPSPYGWFADGPATV